MGDFNSVRSCEEKQGLEGTQRGKELEEFNLFIEEMEFMDIPMVCKHFTIFCPNGKAKSRIDRRYLGSLPLTSEKQPCGLGPKPFGVLNCWFQDSRFFEVMKDAWRKQDVVGCKCL
ncbi:hypothetical protein GmHk_15G044024 [Glycine max]|nr:hypothetical protein GmHk_15G044024 [Glycine max]